MSSVLNVVITNAGIAEVINAQHTGTAPVVLAQVGFGQGVYTPTADQTAMQDEIKRVSTIAGGVVGSNIMHIQALDSGEAAYAVYEIGVYTASGTLFAVYSQPTPILQKVADSSIMCVIDFVLSGVEPTSVTVGDTDFTLAPATTTNQGVVELATDGEVIAGTDTERAITPAGGAAAYVALSGNQTIAGEKTFSDGIKGNITGNVTGNVTGNLAGLIPYAVFYPRRVPVGSILMIMIERQTAVSTPVTIYWGHTVSHSLDGDYRIHGATLSLTGSNVQAVTSGDYFTGTFVLMSTVTFSAQWDICPALAIKISDT